MRGSAKRLFSVSLLLVALLLPARGWAQEETLTPREQALLNTVQALEKRMGELEKEVATLKKAQPVPQSEAQPASNSASKEEPKDGMSQKSVEERVAQLEEDKKGSLKPVWQDGLRVESPDGQFKLQVGGKLFVDWTWFSQDAVLKESVYDEQNGTQIRMGALDLRGQIYQDILYRIEYDFAGNNGPTGFLDAFVGMKNIPYAGTLTIGHFKEPFSLEELTSDTYTTFMERSLPNVFAPARNTGVMLNNAHFGEPGRERLAWAAGVFRRTDNWSSENDANENEGSSVTARVTGLPWYAEDGRRLLHLGVAYSHREPNGGATNRYQLQSWPENRMTGFHWVTTEGYKTFRLQDARAENADLFGLETALVCGPFSLQGEYTHDSVDTTFDSHRAFSGYYAQAGWFLTGENRPYENATGVFGRVKPKKNFAWGKGAGAWELGLRYSYIDLDDGGVRGGKETNYTAGVNWFLNPNVRVMLNYTIASIDHDLYEGDIDILQTRFQVDF
jgi:phosphate-selective porin OprO/OprP